MTSPLDWSLVGVMAKAILAASIVALLVALLWVRERSWWVRVVPVSLAVGLVICVGGYLVVNEVWKPYPDTIPLPLFVWGGGAAFVLCLSAARMRRAGWTVRVLMVLGVVWAIVVVAGQANIHYAAYSTPRKLINPLLHPAADLSSVNGSQTTAVRAPAGVALDTVWQPPPNMPTAGQVVKTSIPSSGGFSPREALLYLPPAYLATPRAELPVLVLIPGDPGKPRDWVDLVDVDAILDEFAAEHKGLAPVVVMADQLGVAEDNSTCVDSSWGTPQTYLAVDLPKWVSTNLHVTDDHSRWAIGGLSSGGTCSLLVGLRAPQIFPNVVDMSGQREPILTSHSETVVKMFNGDEAAYIKLTPKDIMAKRKYPELNVMLTVGSDDEMYKPQQQEILAAAQQAGVNVQWKEFPGGHSFDVFRAAFQAAVPWLAQRMQLTS
jgi:enterochelin esterase-like enzyme